VGTHPVAHLKSSFGRRVAATLVTVLVTAGLLTQSGAAGAEPQPTISEVQAKLKKLTFRENWLIQRYDQVNQDLTSARQRLAMVNREVAKDQTQLAGMRQEIAQIAATIYENGSLTSTAALLTSGNPEAILSQSAILIHLSTANQQQLQQFITTNRQLLGARQMARRTETAVAALKQKLAAQKADLDKLIAQQKSLLSNLTAQQRATQLGGGGSTGGSTTATYSGPTSTQAQQAVAFAYAQLGCPYVYGGTGPCGSGYDCSGLTQAAWSSAGVQIPRTSYEQASLPAVSTSNLQPGDLLLFAGDSHVAIYVGGGYLIDAPMPGMNVEKVSLSSSWYASNLDGAVRP
jgi:cell wall-associated NlpC family hydrolase